MINACCLEHDVELFDGGHEQIIGERGVTLSGGQKARVALARAFYARSEIIVLDDILSALDAGVGAAVLDKLLSESSPQRPSGVGCAGTSSQNFSNC